MSDTEEIEAIREQRLQELQQRAAGPDTTTPSTSPAEPVHIDSESELDRLAEDHRLVLADFYADWCGPCQMLEPTVREIAQNTPAAVAKVDVDALPALAQKLQVQGVPTLFLYVDGEPVKRLVGVQDYGTLESLVEQHAS